MPNSVEIVKRAAVEAVEAGMPVHILFGKVISVSPLKIQVDQKVMLTEKMLILTRNVTDFELDVTVSHQTDIYTGTVEPINHNHPIEGWKKYKVHNALIVGDEVALARVQKGKRYVVLDRIKPIPELKGEWL